MAFALRIKEFCGTLPDTWEGRYVRDQLFRAAAGTAANYHAACRARSPRDFVAKIGIVVEESDESVFWLEFIRQAELNGSRADEKLLAEARELVAIFIASAKTASANLTNRVKQGRTPIARPYLAICNLHLAIPEFTAALP